MKLTKKIYHHWIVKLTVLVLYLLFFAVQIFFNFDTGSQPLFAGQSTFHTVIIRSGSSENIKQGVVSPPVKTKIRLNKRFQPSCIPGLSVINTEMPVFFAEPAQTILCAGNLYASVFQYTHTLRGPPVVA
jgi:hypothetical protein